MNQTAWKLLQPLAILLFIYFAGMVGYVLIEQFSFLEAFYMTTISVTTAGFTEVRKLSDAGRIFTSFLLITSWVAFAFAITRITQYIINGEVNKYFKNRRIMKAIDNLNHHVIVCGFGRNGQQAAQTLGYHSQQYIVIENDQEVMDRIVEEQPGLIYIIGDSTDDDVLIRAGIHRAKALITALPADANNVFIVLSARSLNPGIQIISRASEKNSYAKLVKAGADNVIMPDKIGGTHMATLVSKPDVIEFIDYLSGAEGEAIHIESVSYNELPTDIRGQTLKKIMAWKKTGVNCIGIKDAEGKFIISPPEETIIEKGMKVLVLGTKEQIEDMKGNIK
ncbi:MAG: potassium channel protein [Chitinophagaceae bacterium]|nr:potassium channel protein [Chitinophagaceae bacterium]